MSVGPVVPWRGRFAGYEDGHTWGMVMKYERPRDLPTDVETLVGKGWYVIGHGTTIYGIFPDFDRAVFHLGEQLEDFHDDAFMIPKERVGLR